MYFFARGFWPAEAWKPLIEIILDAHYELVMNAALLNRARHEDEPGAKYVILNTFANFQVDEEVIFNAIKVTLSKFQKVDLHVLIAGVSQPDRHYGTDRGNKIDDARLGGKEGTNEMAMKDVGSFCEIQQTLGTEAYTEPPGYNPKGVRKK